MQPSENVSVPGGTQKGKLGNAGSERQLDRLDFSPTSSLPGNVTAGVAVSTV
jgi:hypothetical protein